MVGVFSFIFIISCVCIWYTIKRKPDKNKRNIAIGVAAISFALVGISGPNDDRQDTSPTSVSSAENKTATETSTDTKRIALSLDEDQMEVDENSNATITGITTPGATVSISAGIEAESVEAGKDGHFSLIYTLAGDENEEIVLQSILDSESTNATMIIEPNKKVLSQKQEEKEAQEAAATAASEEQAALEAAALAAAEETTRTSIDAQAADSGQTEQGYNEPEYVDANGNGLIKGSNNGIYHIPGSRYYNKTTNPAAFFKTVSEAEAAGYRAPKN